MADDKRWIAEAADDLSMITGVHSTKKRNTIIQLVDARIAGRPEETVWRRSDTCSANIYHTKWKHDPIFAHALESVETNARAWHDTRALRALATAGERLALASPAAVAKLIESLDRTTTDAALVVKAAIAILDRAGIETATKSSSTSTFKGYAIVNPADWDEPAGEDG